MSLNETIFWFRYNLRVTMKKAITLNRTPTQSSCGEIDL